MSAGLYSANWGCTICDEQATSCEIRSSAPLNARIAAAAEIAAAAAAAATICRYTWTHYMSGVACAIVLGCCSGMEIVMLAAFVASVHYCAVMMPVLDCLH
jgi:hypothetical protein